MLDVGSVIRTKANIGLVRYTMFAAIVCFLLVTSVFLVTEAVAQGVLSKEAASEIPQNQHSLEKTYTRASLPITKRLQHMCSPARIPQNPEEHSSNKTPPGTASVVKYTLKMT